MKKAFDKIFLTLFALNFLISCETAIEIDVPFDKPELVINSLITPDSAFKIRVSINKFILDPGEIREERKNAIVKVYDANTNELVEQLFYKEIPADPGVTNKVGSYSGIKHPEPDKSYTIKVDDSHYGHAEATTIIPKPISFEVTQIEKPQFNTLGNEQVFVTPIHLQFIDPANEKNFYHLQFITQSYHLNESKDTVWYQNNHQDFYTNDPSLNKQNVMVDYIIFSDQLFNGKTRTLTVNIRNGRPAKVTILLTSLSEEYYLFKTSYDVQYENDGNPFAQPVTVYSNITGGIGIFAGYRYSQKLIRINF